MEKKHLIIPALVAALMGASAPGYAQDRYHGGDRDRTSQHDRGNDRYNHDRHDRNDHNDRNYRYNNDRNDHHDRNGRYDHDRNDRYDRRDGYRAQGGGRGNEGWGEEHRYNGAGPDHSFRRGQRLPSRYRNHQYVVNNYREHHLRPPPRGYHWVQTGADYVLAAVATGLIADLIINY